MDERLKENELFQTAHIMILICYTIFASILIAESILLGWEIWAMVLIAAGITSGWVIHIRGRFPEHTRLWIYSLLMMATFFFYGSHPTSTYDLGTVMTAVIVLYTMTGVKKLITLCQATFLLTFAYDIAGMISSGFVFTPLEITRSLLHIAMIIMTGWVARVIIDRWGRVLSRVGRELTLLKDGTGKLNDFLANVSHEIRTPVNAVLGFTEVSLEMEKDERILGNMEAVMQAGRRINDQISDILDYSEIYRDSLAENIEDYMLSSIIFDVSAQLMPLMLPARELILDVAPRCPRVMRSDSVKLKKILHHVLENSLKYTPEGGVYAQLSTEKTDYGANLCIEVEDTGTGMDENEAERSREGFYQGDSSRIRQGGGLGLGLSIVHGFVAAMGGFMTINSRPGEGTTVRITLPQQVADEENCIALSGKESLNLGAYVRFEKFKSPDVREYYGRLMSRAVSGMEITIHRAESFEELKRLCENTVLSHLLIGREEYEENRDFMEALTEKTIVVIAAGEDFVPGESSRCIRIPKPVTTFSIAEILNMKPGLGQQEKTRLRLEGVRALVVDDEAMNLSVAKGIFERYGMLVDGALSGYEAIERTAGRDYDIVFMDHMMPGMDGIETAKRIWKQSDEKGRRPAMVALTANAVSTAKEMFLSEGFDGFLMKPIETGELERILKRVLPGEKLRYEVIPAAPGKKAEEASESSVSPEGKETDTLAASEEAAPGSEIDFAQGLAYCQDDQDLYASVLTQYADDYAEKTAKLEQSFQAGDLKSYEIYVHGLKSTSKMIGATALSERARQLEITASQGIAVPEGAHRELMEQYRLITEIILREKTQMAEHEDADAADGIYEMRADEDGIFEFEAVLTTDENTNGD